MLRLLPIAIVGVLAVAAPATSPEERNGPPPTDVWLCDEIQTAWEDAGHAAPIYSAVISRAADRLLDRVADASAQDLPAHWSRTVRFELLREDVRNPQFLPLLLEGDHPSDLLDRLRWVLNSDLCPAGLNRYGFSLRRRNGRLHLSLILVHRLVDLGAFPAEVQPGHSQLFWGTWGPGYGAPRVLIASPGGGTVELMPQEAAEMFWTRLYFPEEGVYTVEVMLSGPGGPETAALFDVYSGVPRPTLPSVRLCAPHDGERTEDLEAALLSMMNRERVRRGIEPLAQSSSVRRCARQHSEAMAARQLLAHRLPDPRDADCPAARQNIVMDRTLCGAHQQLMESPSHRRNILDREASSCGVGVSMAKVMPGVDLYYITQEFIGGASADRKQAR
ncbi:MAG: CAP domain-containing protein [Pseudomonadota bacterium]